MATLGLTSRKTQREILTSACAQRVAARITAMRKDTPMTSVDTHFLAFDARGLILDWPAAGLGSLPSKDSVVDVSFTYGDEPLMLRTHSLGRIQWLVRERGMVPAWRLAVPLRIHSRQQRVHPRFTVDQLGTITVRFQNVEEPGRQFVGDLENISVGGLGVQVMRSDAPRIVPGALHWATFELPEQPTRLEFVTRIVHAHPIDGLDKVTLGCAICPGDDPAEHHARLERIASYVDEHGNPEGEESCS